MSTVVRISLLLAVVVLAANAQDRLRPRTCGQSEACHPWKIREGPYCGRGNPMNYRFTLDLAPENYVVDATGTQTQITYGFCPRVDELKAFNLTDAVGLITVDRRSNATFSRRVSDSYVSVFGFGPVNSSDPTELEFPPISSPGKVRVFEYGNICPPDSVAVADFLILNVTMDNGKFRYWPDHPQPAGVGFAPTCSDETNPVCMFDSDKVCIGPRGNAQCASCVSLEEANSKSIQIWTSYYGTDKSGRVFKSGANNPLNFRAYSGSGVYSATEKSVDRLKSGKTAQDDELEP